MEASKVCAAPLKASSSSSSEFRSSGRYKSRLPGSRRCRRSNVQAVQEESSLEADGQPKVDRHLRRREMSKDIVYRGARLGFFILAACDCHTVATTIGEGATRRDHGQQNGEDDHDASPHRRANCGVAPQILRRCKCRQLPERPLRAPPTHWRAWLAPATELHQEFEQRYLVAERGCYAG